MPMKAAVEPAYDILTIAVGAPGDPDGAKLRQLLERELDYERGRAAWRRWLWVLAAVTGIRWLVWPQLAWMVPIALGGIAMPVWVAVSARTAVAAAVVWYRSRRWDDALANHPAATVRSPSP